MLAFTCWEGSGRIKGASSSGTGITTFSFFSSTLAPFLGSGLAGAAGFLPLV